MLLNKTEIINAQSHKTEFVVSAQKVGIARENGREHAAEQEVSGGTLRPAASTHTSHHVRPQQAATKQKNKRFVAVMVQKTKVRPGLGPLPEPML